MTAPAYTVVQTNLRTGTVVTRLPVTGITFTHTLNAAGSATIGVPLFAPEANPASLSPGISGLVILRAGVPVWGGILWTASADIEAGTLTLGAAGYHSHYRGRYFVNGWTARTLEQADLLKAWFAYFNADNGIGTVTDLIKPTGAKRTALWSRSELKNAAEAIEELADNVGGFNFRYVPYWVTPGVTVGHRFAMTSRTGSASRTLTHRANCDMTTVSYDSTALATVAYATGADNGNGEKLVGIFENAELGARMPERVMIGAYPDVKETQTLIGKAQATINAGSAPVAVPELTLYPGQFTPLDFAPGDYVTAEANAGYVAFLDDFVVTECATTVDTNGTELVRLALANKEVFNNANPS
ncbi:hypothetical protein OG914_06720 [Streptomyces sp. NBC_00291]|uniref:hypothetical protein n=1 Tax=Streptomyces sp. NBC_00291 TaxID=2975704 RepID=UPI002253F30F|nr:hypothetical protein [Streptomyces sp. NBC_00291]MCX5153703.1 hypothetical protein [Streptomyces sp. NBC_00291]